MKLLRQSSSVRLCGKSVESSLVLYTILFWLADHVDEATEVLEQLKRDLPNSPIIMMLDGFKCMMKEKDTARAIQIYQRAEAITQVPQMKASSLLEAVFSPLSLNRFPWLARLQAPTSVGSLFARGMGGNHQNRCRIPCHDKESRVGIVCCLFCCNRSLPFGRARQMHRGNASLPQDC